MMSFSEYDTQHRVLGISALNIFSLFHNIFVLIGDHSRKCTSLKFLHNMVLGALIFFEFIIY